MKSGWVQQTFYSRKVKSNEIKKGVGFVVLEDIAIFGRNIVFLYFNPLDNEVAHTNLVHCRHGNIRSVVIKNLK